MFGAIHGREVFVRLFELEPDLLRDAPVEIQERLRIQTTLPLLHADPGPWTPPLWDQSSVGLLVVSGFLCRVFSLFERDGVELLGPGDVVRPWQHEHLVSIPHATEWRALTVVELGVLDRATSELLAKVPGAFTELVERVVRRANVLSAQLAIARIRGVAPRLLVLLWCLADRWGRRESGQTVLPMPLTHELLADLVCAERPWVSVALKTLVTEDRISRRDDGLWVLHGIPPTEAADLIIMQGKAAESLVAAS